MEVMHQIVVFIFLAVHGTIAIQTVHYTETKPWFAEPVPNVTVAEGSNVTIPCQVESMGEKYAVSWIHLDTNNLLTYNNLTITRDPRFGINVLDNQIFSLEIQKVRFNDSGSYLCQLNTSPMKESVGYLQVVKAEASIVERHDDCITIDGLDITFLCQVDSLGENNTVTWKHFGRNGNLTINNQTVTRDPRVSIDVINNQNFTLKIRNIQLADSGRYMCQLNTEPVKSKVSLLEVFVLEFENHYSQVEAVIGENAILRCDLTSYPSPNTNWKRDGEETEIVSNSKYEAVVLVTGQKVQMTLIIKNVKPEDFGSYICGADNTFNWEKETVILRERQPFFAEALPNVTVFVGSDVTIPCIVESAGENYRVLWLNMDKKRLLTFNNRIITGDTRISLTVRNNRIFLLRIQNVQVEDSGRLACQIYSDTKKSNIGFLQVIEQSDPNAATYTFSEDSKTRVPPKISIPNCLLGGDVGEYVTLRCNLKSKPNSLTYWKLDGEGLTAFPNLKGTISIIEKGNNEVQMKLGIQILSPDDFGTYTCVAKNTFGEAEGHIILHNISEPHSSRCPSGEGTVRSTAESPPKIEIPITLVAALVSENATLVCNVVSNPEPTVTWTLGNGEILTTNTKYEISLNENGVNKKQMRLTINNIQLVDFGSYKCIASNSLGEAVGEITTFEQFQYPFGHQSRFGF